MRFIGPLFGELRVWHFAFPALLCYAVPLGLHIQTLWKSGGVFAALVAVFAAIPLSREGCRTAPRPLEHGSGVLSLLLIEFATLLILWAGVELNTGLAYVSFVTACAAGVLWLGAWPLFFALLPVWVLAALFTPFAITLFTDFSLQIWNGTVALASRLLDFCLVPNGIQDEGITLTGGRFMIVPEWAFQNFILTGLSLSIAFCLLRGRSVFVALPLSVLSLLLVPLLALMCFVLQGVLISHFDVANVPYLTGFVILAGYLLGMIFFQTLGHPNANWIWKFPQNDNSASDSIFEGCDFSPSLFFVLLLLVLAGAGTSLLLIISTPGSVLFEW
jgi:hypothetical protein